MPALVSFVVLHVPFHIISDIAAAAKLQFVEHASPDGGAHSAHVVFKKIKQGSRPTQLPPSELHGLDPIAYMQLPLSCVAS